MSSDGLIVYDAGAVVDCVADVRWRDGEVLLVIDVGVIRAIEISLVMLK